MNVRCVPSAVALHGLPCLSLSRGDLALLIAETVGPRILSLRLGDSPNLLAEIPDFTIDCPGVGPLRLWGGHRLWHAPEVARRTYLPDDQPVQIAPIPDGVAVTQPAPAETGLEKRLEIALPSAETVRIAHSLINRSLWEIVCAPWAITQLRPGGVAVLPQPTAPADPDGLQPNRSLALWPYTDMRSPHIRWGNRFLRVTADLTEGALKIGFPNPAGWLAYQIDGLLFVKTAACDAAAVYPDRGSSSQCYANQRFLELETLGPLVAIPPGGAARHVEEWRVLPADPPPAAEDDLAAWAADLGLL